MRKIALAGIMVVLAAAVSSCDAPGAVAQLEPASGLMVMETRRPGDLLPSIGVRPGNSRTTWQTVAAASPAQLAPAFARYRAARAAGRVPADEELVFPAATRDALATMDVGAANICAALGAQQHRIRELPKDRHGGRQVGLRCN